MEGQRGGPPIHPPPRARGCREVAEGGVWGRWPFASALVKRAAYASYCRHSAGLDGQMEIKVRAGSKFDPHTTQRIWADRLQYLRQDRGRRTRQLTTHSQPANRLEQGTMARWRVTPTGGLSQSAVTVEDQRLKTDQTARQSGRGTSLCGEIFDILDHAVCTASNRKGNTGQLPTDGYTGSWARKHCNNVKHHSGGP
jgi:hypothetical protein